ncbi:hypothetical protein SAY87_025059 [Trapa incisa]|uniref:COP1-interacting protein 7 n=1 Tax=Trapa incisa TaxID=236973 RepID=A0AAN7J947_9MYRT|nr:hypothetical protein SAY87_025059 [Trapa incisa]
MKSDMPLDYAVFQLSPKRSRCELIVSSNGQIEKLASGLVKPFITHLKVAEEQFTQDVQSIKLESRKFNIGGKSLTKATLERFVRFVSTPEVLELVSTLDTEMSQLEAARKIYSQGTGDQCTNDSGGIEARTASSADATKMELLRAIDVRLSAARMDLATACTQASAAGFNPDSVSELHLFAESFGAYRLNEACTKFLSLYQKRPELSSLWKPNITDYGVRSSCESDMSLDDPTEESYSTLMKPSSIISHQEMQWTIQKEKENTDQSGSMAVHQSNICFPATDHHINQKDSDEKRENDDTTSIPVTVQINRPTRRLSVQDRINLFEGKQKENAGGGSGNKSVVKPSEIRRLSSDVSSAPAAVERVVLRRWSGASDMSIELSSEKKDNNSESTLCTPSSASLVSQTNETTSTGVSEVKNTNETSVSTGSDKFEIKSMVDNVSDLGVKDGGGPQPVITSLSGKAERNLRGSINKMDNLSSHMLKTPFNNMMEQAVSSQDSSQNKVKFEVQMRGSYKESKDQATIEYQPKSFSRSSEVASKNQSGGRAVNAQDKNELLVQSRFRGLGQHSCTFSEQFEDCVILKAVDTQEKGINRNQLLPEMQLKSHADMTRKELPGLEKLQISEEESARLKIKSQKSVSAVTKDAEKSQTRWDDISSGDATFSISSRKVSENQRTSFTPPKEVVEPLQRARPSKGSQELNDDLKMKANELEKLFAEHKLRVPADQSSRRSKPTDASTHKETAGSSEYGQSAASGILTPSQFPEKRAVKIGGPSGMSNFSTPSTKIVENNVDLIDGSRNDNYDVNDSRGKFYEKYMVKRDARLREESGSKREEKEAKLKSMHDILERSRAEMNARLMGSAERRDMLSSASRRVEKLRSFSRSSMKREQPIDFFQSEEEESGFAEDKPNPPFGEAALGDGATRSTLTKKPLPNRNLSSSIPRTSAASASRSSLKASNFSSARRKAPSENPLAQSVPNFSDLRKENTKPSSGHGKAIHRSQVRSYTRSKSTNDNVAPVKEERTQRSQSLRRSSAGPGEIKEFSPLCGDMSVLIPLELDKGYNDQNPKGFTKFADSKPSIQITSGTGASYGGAKWKASVTPQHLMNDVEFNDLAFEVDDTEGMVVDEEDGEDEDSENPRFCHYSGSSVKTENDNGDYLQPVSQLNPALIPQLPASVPSKFFPESLILDSPGESPASWNSHMHNPFSFPHETSDVDASADSPTGSPASCNSHSLVQGEVDAARMRKKWGSAQKPILVANSSHNQSRKDVTKGFKRLLKFGRKTRGAESLVDWISATTSEGDDDTEDGRESANRSSEDLRKSRMGFPQSHSDDIFMESELLNEQDHSSIPAAPANFKLRDDHMAGSSLKAPRSFFSLSTFRSKANDAKLR